MTKKRERTMTQHDIIVTTAQLPKSQNPSETAAQGPRMSGDG